MVAAVEWTDRARHGDAVAVGDLDLVERFELDPRVGAFGDEEFEVGLEIAEILAADQVRRPARWAVDEDAVGGEAADQHSALDRAAAALAGLFDDQRGHGGGGGSGVEGRR